MLVWLCLACQQPTLPTAAVARTHRALVYRNVVHRLVVLRGVRSSVGDVGENLPRVLLGRNLVDGLNFLRSQESRIGDAGAKWRHMSMLLA